MSIGLRAEMVWCGTHGGQPPPLQLSLHFSSLVSALSISHLAIYFSLLCLERPTVVELSSALAKPALCIDAANCDGFQVTTNFTLPQSGSLIESAYQRFTRSLVIEAVTTFPMFGSVMTTTEESMSVNSSLESSKKHSTQIPKLGFGDFHNPNENYDDEDYDIAKNGNHEQPRSNTQNEIRKEFGDFSSKPFHEMDFDYFDYDKKVERMLIIGDESKLPSAEMYLMQHASPVTFEGCFCDRHYQLLSVNGELSGESPPLPLGNSSSMVRERGIYCYCFGTSVTQLPRNFSSNVRKIVLKRVSLRKLQAGDLQIYPNLTEIHMHVMHQLHMIEAGAFAHLPLLNTIYIKMAPELRHIPDGVFMGSLPKLLHLKITHSGLKQLPVIYQDNSDQIISMIDFDNSRICNITTRSINVNAESLNIEYNQIEFVSNYAFFGSKIAKLSLKGNKKLVYLEELAFSGLNFLRELDLSQTSITKLPTMGLSDTLEILRLVETFTLKVIPSIYHFKQMKEAHLTYPYHCCAFQFPANHDPVEYARIKKLLNTDKYCFGRKGTRNRTLNKTKVLRDTQTRYGQVNSLLEKFINWLPYWNNNSTNNRIKRHIDKSNDNESNVFGVLLYEQKNDSDRKLDSFDILSKLNKKGDNSHDNADDMGDLFDYKQSSHVEDLPGTFGTPHTSITPKQEFCGDIASYIPLVRCYPKPDAFNPCEDVMGKNYLRIIVWFVAFAAVSGNVAVIVVLVSSRFTFNVSKFLMINLSIADLMMGVYLFIIAIVDFRTQGVYFNYAIDWQHGLGCKIAGFITVFSQLLSIFTLTVITLERWFAITYAIQLNRRLKLSLAVKVMIGGWLFVIMMATLPLFGISSYSKTSICLPMEHQNVGDNLYLTSLLIINQLAFILITACYIKMYVSIISQKTRATMNDMTIAKRMALLVFTDFACWAPIAFFGLTALAGYPLIDLTNSKILLVTIYPLNSCANPFLYVIFTKQYRRDFFILASRYGLCKKQALQYKNTRHQVNYLNHHHHHVRPNTLQNSSEIAPRPNQCAKAIPASGSIFSQVSCDGQNVHLYKYICKGHHHHHFCAAYHSHSSPVSASGANGTSAPGANAQHASHSAEHISQYEPESDKGCSKCAYEEGLEMQPEPSSCGSEKSSKHWKHKRCHHVLHPHQSRSRHASRPTGAHHTRCHHKNHYSTCCRSAVFSTVDIYPELSNSNNSETDQHRRRHLECESCSCACEGDTLDKECSCSREHIELAKLDKLSPDGCSSSCEKVHISRSCCQHKPKCRSDGRINGRVAYTRNKNVVINMDKVTEKKKSTKSKNFFNFLSKIPIVKLTGKEKTQKKSAVAERPESSETSSPYSSGHSSKGHHRRHRHHESYHCRHYRCYSCNPQHRKAQSNPHLVVEKEISCNNPLPVEEQREILRQALQETTTVQEAVAVVEELSSGTRISMNSSSSSKKTVKPSQES